MTDDEGNVYNSGVRHSVREGGVWTHGTAVTGSVSGHVAIALDPQDRKAILYVQESILWFSVRPQALHNRPDRNRPTYSLFPSYPLASSQLN